MRSIITCLGILCLSCLFLGCISTPAATPDAPVVFAVPRVNRTEVTAAAAGWGDAGFQVNMLAEFPVGLVGRRNPSPTFRLAWNERGLLFWLNVPDAAPVEEATHVWEGDSVELILARADEPTQQYQMVLSPGVTAEFPQPRLAVYVHGAPQDQASGPSVQYVRAAFPGGYRIEALLPWSNLHLSAAPGTELLFQLYVHNHAPGDGAFYRSAFFPSINAPYSTTDMHRLILAEKPSAPVNAAAAGAYQRFRRTLVTVTRAGAWSQKPQIVQVCAGPTVLGGAPLMPGPDGDASRVVANVVLPMPSATALYGPLTVRLDGQVVAVLSIPAPEGRASAVGRAQWRFESTVFAGPRFPSGEFQDPLYVEDVIGPYSVSTAYYDAAGASVAAAEKPGRYGAVVTVTAGDGATYKRYATLYRLPEPIDRRAGLGPIGAVLPRELGIDPAVVKNQAAQVVESFKRLVLGSARQNSDAAVVLAGLAEMSASDPPTVARTGCTALDRRYWAMLRYRTEGYVYPHLVLAPQSYRETGTDRVPVLLFLHGSGGNGEDLDLLRHEWVIQYREAHPDFPFLLILPQCPSNASWNPWTLSYLLDEIDKQYRVDADRIYVTGASMGGYGTWSLATLTPERFAAAAPVCGIGDQQDVARLKDLPIWAFHGENDYTVPVGPDRAMVAALQRLGARVKMTVYPGVGHESWVPTYTNPEFYAWLLAQKRGAPTQPRAHAVPAE